MAVLTILEKSHFGVKSGKIRHCTENICIFSINQFLAVQGPFFHQYYNFCFFRLVIRLFCGSFNDFQKISFLGSKMVNKYVPKICSFSTNQFLAVQGAAKQQIQADSYMTPRCPYDPCIAPKMTPI